MKKILFIENGDIGLDTILIFFSTDKNFTDTYEEIGRQVETEGENTIANFQIIPRKEDKAKQKDDREIDTQRKIEKLRYIDENVKRER